MLFKQLKYFITVVDCRSFTEAAEICFISQSAISQQIKALENDLGVILLIREGRHFTLTPAGEYFYRHGKVILDEVDQFKEETIRRGEDSELNMTIGYPKNFSALELYEAVARFSDTYPEVKISIVTGTHEELFELLINQQLDIKISEQRRAFHDEYYNFELKYSASYVELSIQNTLSNKDILSINDLEKLSCILVTTKGKEESEREFYEKTLGVSNRFLYTDSLEQARLMVLSNRGYLLVDEVGKLPEPLIGIKRISIQKKGRPMQRNYFACWNKERTNYYIEEFAKIFKELLNK